MRTRRSLDELKSLVQAGDEHAFYVSREWKDKRSQILERDHYECQRCNGNFVIEDKPIKKIRITKAKYIHHIIPLKKNFEKALDDENLVSLCFRCHEVVEGRDERWYQPIKKKMVNEERW